MACCKPGMQGGPQHVSVPALCAAEQDTHGGRRAAGWLHLGVWALQLRLAGAFGRTQGNSCGADRRGHPVPARRTACVPCGVTCATVFVSALHCMHSKGILCSCHAVAEAASRARPAVHGLKIVFKCAYLQICRSALFTWLSFSRWYVPRLRTCWHVHDTTRPPHVPCQASSHVVVHHKQEPSLPSTPGRTRLIRRTLSDTATAQAHMYTSSGRVPSSAYPYPLSMVLFHSPHLPL